MSVGLNASDVELLRLKAALVAEFPDFRIYKKADFWWMQALSIVMKVATFGLTISFMSQYVTTVGHTVYVGTSWADHPAYMQAALLRHEAVHMRQRRRLGALRYVLTYLLWPFPVFFAKGRRDLEMEAYTETLRAYFEYYGEFVALDRGIRDRIIGEFLSPSYFWMWPFRKSIERWYDDTIAELATSTTRIVHGQKG